MKKLTVAILFLTPAPALYAGVITSYGAVDALTTFNFTPHGTADFDEGPIFGDIPLDAYSSQGLTFHTGALSSILPGVTNPGSARNPEYPGFFFNPGLHFPGPIAGGGVQNGQYARAAGVATFDPSLDITRFGLTASLNLNQFMTAWDRSGNLIGQVNWQPDADSSFVGIDTQGVPIGMIAYGNDDLFNGETYNTDGFITYSDTWVWAEADGPASVPEPGSCGVLGLMLCAGAIRMRRRRKKANTVGQTAC